MGKDFFMTNDEITERINELEEMLEYEGISLLEQNNFKIEIENLKKRQYLLTEKKESENKEKNKISNKKIKAIKTHIKKITNKKLRNNKLFNINGCKYKIFGKKLLDF